MKHVEDQLICTLESLGPSKSAWKDRAVTASLAAVGALAFFFALQSTKPADVLERVNQLQLDVDEMQEQIDGMEMLLYIEPKNRVRPIERKE